MKPEICLAPLRGVTDAIFRTTFAEFFHGVDWAMAPFVSTTRGPRIKPSHLFDLLPENNRGLPVEPQVMSKTAEHFVPMATALYDMGYESVNWNLGCPYPMVAKKMRGSGLLNRPEMIETFLERAIPLLPCKLSIKMRLGRHHKEEIFDLLPMLDRFPIDAITIHPRTGVQMYTGHADWDAFERCLERTRHPVIYNGDIVNKITFDTLRQRFPTVRAWMIGRGAVIDPFLPDAIKGQGVDPDRRLALFQEFHQRLYQRYAKKLYGPSHLLSRMKGLWGYFHHAFAEGRRWRKKINKTQKPSHFEAIVRQFFDTGPRWRNEVTDDR